jgi:CheY-like chemotaxis protein
VRILVADDNQVNQRVAQKMLARLGYRADAVGNGAEVLEALQRVPYDIILMDCQMPEMDGWQATREIRAAGAIWSHVRVVALTANAMSGDREHGLEVGMDDYIVKPVTLHELRQAIERNLPQGGPAEVAGRA